MYFATFLTNAKGLQHGTIIGYLYGVQVLHIDMGLSDPLKGTLCLHKCLLAIHMESNPEYHKLAFTYDLLVLAQPLHKFSCTASVMGCLDYGPFGLLWTGKFMGDQECFDPMQHLCIQDMMPSLSAQSEL